MRLIRRSVGRILLMVQLAGCWTYQPSRLSPEAAVQDHEAVLVKLDDGSSVRLQAPWVRGDSLGGLRIHGGGAYGGRPETTEWATPLHSVTDIETKRFNALATIGVPLGIFGGLLAIGLVGCAASGGCVPMGN